MKDMSGPIGLEVQHPETEYRLKKVSEKFIESIHLMVNEPSVGLYRIQEHVRRSLPQLVDKKMELRSCQNQINGVCYDLDYSIKTVQSMQHIPHFTIIQECLRSAIASKKNLDAAKLERRSKKVDEGSGAQSADAVSEVSIETQDVEGFICPNCMQVLTSQDELLEHWQSQHETANDTRQGYNDDANNDQD
ncbi:BLOC-1-related complex subunit 8 homolog isoform X2 [Nematostella vectensis]|uniref:BLOC-1-related complex subunit 8 homolog isoform X2 n=1 Tax=Nematostella vectensis TaxID=45351 RepID=UPI0020776285|nr:BLOC-1-related complex subunit 8 homolog isoform X2 [Nematostella vectensis]